jgi:phage terminase large subunit-like protein
VVKLNNKAYQYASDVVNGKIPAPKYVIKQCQEFLNIADGKNPKYLINKAKVKQIESILKILIMPKGLKAGQSIYECSCGYQWVFYISILCVVYRDNLDKRRYETAILEIARKNFKTYTIATIFILLFLLEPKYSKFYSVAPDGSLSREVKTAIEETLKSSPLIYIHKESKRFKILRDYIQFNLTESRYYPLNYSSSRMDGKLPNVFLADEVGALPNPYAIESMRSGQLNILNKLGCIISTKYPTFNNPFEDEVGYAKRVLDGIEGDETVFALLYEPDEELIQKWTTDDNVLKHSNPVALEIPEIWEDLIKKRAKAIAVESVRENFLTKHCNIIYQGMGTESYIDINDVMSCKVAKINWTGRKVYLGVDLAMTNDNCAVAMVSEEDNEILADVVAFIPEGRIDEKNKFEKIDYNEFIKTMKCIACGNKTVDYGIIEDFVFKIEEKYKVSIVAIGYDRYNALSSAQKWEQKYNTVEIRQHSDTLHSPTKLLYEKILDRKFRYEENKLLEINFENARCTYDTNMNRYITKKRSQGKVDMVVALINAVYLLQQDVFLDNEGFFVQVIE